MRCYLIINTELESPHCYHIHQQLPVIGSTKAILIGSTKLGSSRRSPYNFANREKPPWDSLSLEHHYFFSFSLVCNALSGRLSLHSLLFSFRLFDRHEPSFEQECQPSEPYPPNQPEWSFEMMPFSLLSQFARQKWQACVNFEFQIELQQTKNSTCYKSSSSCHVPLKGLLWYTFRRGSIHLSTKSIL